MKTEKDHLSIDRMALLLGRVHLLTLEETLHLQECDECRQAFADVFKLDLYDRHIGNRTER